MGEMIKYYYQLLCCPCSQSVISLHSSTILTKDHCVVFSYPIGYL